MGATSFVMFDRRVHLPHLLHLLNLLHLPHLLQSTDTLQTMTADRPRLCNSINRSGLNQLWRVLTMRATAPKEAVPFVERLVFYSRANRYHRLSRLWKGVSVFGVLCIIIWWDCVTL